VTRHTAKALGVLAFAAAVVVAGCAPGRSASVAMTKIRVGPTQEPASAPIFVAKEKGFFAEEGLDASITVFPSGRAGMEAALAGETDFATVAETPVARAVLDGKDPIIVATIAEVEGANVIVGRRDRGVSDAHSLVGKRVGVLVGTTADYFLDLYLVSSGVDPKTVVRVPLQPAGLVRSIKDGSVDAVAAFVPYYLEALDALGTNGVLLDKPGLYAFFWNVAVDRRVSQRRAGEVQRFLRAIAKAEAFMSANEGEAIGITSRGTGLPTKTLRRIWPQYQWGVRLDQTLVLSLEDEARWMSGRQQTPDFLPHIDAAPLRRLAPDNVTLIGR
jgi:NitT/TauT family transport system substrate-binding protein